MAFWPSDTLSDGVRSSCAGQRAMPLAPDHLPPRDSQMRRAVASKELFWVEYRLGYCTSRSFRLAHKGPPPLQPFCVVRTGRRGFTSALRARRFERHIDIAAHPRGLPIIRSDFSLAPLILIAAPRPGQFRSCDTLPNRKFQSDLSFCKSRRAFGR